MKVLTTLAILLMVAPAFANHEDSHPCKAIRAACEGAGFRPHEHKSGKGLWLDCVDKIMKGETVPGVTVAASDVDGCKAKKAEHEAKKAEHKK
jgi:hypothetical protein